MKRSARQFFFCFEARYGLAAAYPTNEPGTWWLPSIKQRGVIGISLFDSQSQSIRQATANVERIAAATGETAGQVVERLRGEFDGGARAERRVQVSGPVPPLPSRR